MKARIFALTLSIFSAQVSWSDQACAAALSYPAIYALTNPDHSSTRPEFDNLLKQNKFAERGGQLREDLGLGKFINCHAYAAMISDVPGITDHTWIVPSNSSDANTRSVYYEGLLDRYFTPVMTLDLTKESPPGLDRIQSGDLVVFFSKQEILHSGVVNGVYGGRQKYVQIHSKLGPWPVIDASLELTKTLYSADMAVVYRRNQYQDQLVTVPFAH